MERTEGVMKLPQNVHVQGFGWIGNKIENVLRFLLDFLSGHLLDWVASPCSFRTKYPSLKALLSMLFVAIKFIISIPVWYILLMLAALFVIVTLPVIIPELLYMAIRSLCRRYVVLCRYYKIYGRRK